MNIGGLIGFVFVLGIIGAVIGLIVGGAQYLTHDGLPYLAAFIVFAVLFRLTIKLMRLIAQPEESLRQTYVRIARHFKTVVFLSRDEHLALIKRAYQSRVAALPYGEPSDHVTNALFRLIEIQFRPYHPQDMPKLPRRSLFRWGDAGVPMGRGALIRLDEKLQEMIDYNNNYQADCIEFLLQLAEQLPSGAFKSHEEDSGHIRERLGGWVESVRPRLEQLVSARLHISPEFVSEAFPTVFQPLFDVQIPFIIDDEIRFRHQWIIGPSGTGKTSLIEAMILADLHKVAVREASIVVIDSQGQKPGTLIGNLIRLYMFAPGDGALYDRLVYLDPDPAHPLALNLLDFGLNELRDQTPRQKREYLNSVIDTFEYVIAGLVGAEYTSAMRGVATYIIQALAVIPDATVITFKDLMAKDGWKKYQRHIDTLDPYTRDFFYSRFDGPDYKETKAGIFRRLDMMLAQPSFREMFLHPRNRLNLAEELNAGKIIIVHTDLALLQATGTELFGRYILTKLLLATRQRADEENPMPTYVYIDEAHDYIHSEERVAEFMDKARKQKISLTFAHHRLSQMKSRNVLDALSNSAIQFAGGNRDDAAALARLLHTDPAFIESKPPLHFAAFVKDHLATAVEVTVPYQCLSVVRTMTADDEQVMRQEMWNKYSVPREPDTNGATSAETSSPLPPEPPVDTKPSKWRD